MAEKNNKINLRTLVLAIMIIGGIVSAFVFFDGQIDGRIESHPKVIGLEKAQEYTERELGEIKEQLLIINQKIDKLLDRK